MTLDAAPAGTDLVVVATGGPAGLADRLAALGLRPGERVRALHRTTGRGLVVAVADDRLALARSVLQHVEVAFVRGGGAT